MPRSRFGIRENVPVQNHETMKNDAILNLRFKKVYIMPCFKEKLLVPGAFFDKANITTLYTASLESAA